MEETMVKSIGKIKSLLYLVVGLLAAILLVLLLFTLTSGQTSQTVTDATASASSSTTSSETSDVSVSDYFNQRTHTVTSSKDRYNLLLSTIPSSLRRDTEVLELPAEDLQINSCDLYFRNISIPGESPFSNVYPSANYYNTSYTKERRANGSVSSLKFQVPSEVADEYNFGFNVSYDPAVSPSYKSNVTLAVASAEFSYDLYKVYDGYTYAYVGMQCQLQHIPTGNIYYRKDTTNKGQFTISMGDDSSSSTSSNTSANGLPTPETMYRYYRPNAGTHFYSSDKNLSARFPEYELEKAAFKVFPKQDASTYSSYSDIVPVHRFYNGKTGAHLFTVDTAQVQRIKSNYPDFSYEGIKFYVYKSSSSQGESLRRFYNNSVGVHFFTTFTSEINTLLNDSRFTMFKDEGVAFKVVAL